MRIFCIVPDALLLARAEAMGNARGIPEAGRGRAG